ncbi:MAG: HDIG domain-containing protein [Defluviitaleaceae bacterium]|nr:HDIG domain-containing protein [Defluviitaleaceae bacterium]MCL2262940.1 HDIG domain-containing protein [Defluviitaleaceae bacterium]
MRKHLINAILIFAAFAVTCLAIATGSYFNAGLIMQVDTVSEILVRAPRDTEDAAGTERNRQAALRLAEGLQEVFSVDHSEWITVANNLGMRRAEIEGIREEYRRERAAYEYAHETLEDRIFEHRLLIEQAQADWVERVNAAALAGETPPSMPSVPPSPQPPVWEGEVFEAFARLPLLSELSVVNQEFIVSMTGENFAQMWDALEAAAEVVQNAEVIHYPVVTTVAMDNAVRNALRPAELDRAREELAGIIVLESLRANAIPNEEINQRNFLEAVANYEIEIIPEGAIIIDEGQLVTQEIFDILAGLDMLAPESLLDNLYPMLGVFFLVSVLFLGALMYLKFYHKSIAANLSEATLLFTLYTLTVVLVWAFGNMPFPFLPILIFPTLVAILIDRRCATALNFALILVCFFIVSGDLTYLLFYSAAGMLFCMFSKYTTERGRFIWVGILISAIMFMLSIAVTFITDRNAVFYDVGSIIMTAGFAALMGILTIFICMGSLPLWETFFGVVTPIKLLDLTNPTNLLLRRLMIEAPGTYHHSLIVANLAETAALDIGANAHAARVGGYYHDAGKLKYPHYFVENLDGGENPHDHLEPRNSTQIIMSHVAYGLTLATEHKLPQFVRDIIKEHHGTTLMQFFYLKARGSEDGCEESDFRYPFTIPQTRESACVMLADSVEAAVRSMIPKISSLDEVEKTIRHIIRGKLNDGQLAESDLSIKDVTIIEQSFFRVLKGMYHERIAYPKENKK